MGRREWKILGHRFFAVLGVGALPIGILAPLDPKWWEGNWWPVGLVVAGAVAWAVLGLRHRDPKHFFAQQNVTIRLVVGDLFDQGGSVIVGFTNTFDTAVPDVIASNSVQGVLLSRIYNGSQARLDTDLDARLLAHSPIGTITKPGKTQQYALGTVVTLQGEGSVHYYCAAYTQMNHQNVAQGSIQGVLDGLNNCWEEANAHGNGNPLSVPLIGQGQSRIPELTAEMSIRLIAFSFLLRSRRGRFASELRIVVHPHERAKIDYREYQAFLTSLDA